jgi:hypothetical protein
VAEIRIVETDEWLTEELGKVLVKPFDIRYESSNRDEVDNRYDICNVLRRELQFAWIGSFKSCDCHKFYANVGEYSERYGDPIWVRLEFNDSKFPTHKTDSKWLLATLGLFRTPSLKTIKYQLAGLILEELPHMYCRYEDLPR